MGVLEQMDYIFLFNLTEEVLGMKELLIHSWFSGFSLKGMIMAVKLICMDWCQTSWMNKTNHSRALLRGE